MLSHLQALQLLKSNITRDNLFKHSLETEAIMRALARKLKENEEEWDLCGLLHDIDFEKTAPTYEQHGTFAETLLKGKVSPEIIRAIKAHNYEQTGINPQTRMENGLICADSVSGLIIAMALMLPSKKLADVKVESIKKRYKDKVFAKNCSRERMAYCEKIGLPLDEFLSIALDALKGIASELGL